MSKRSVLLFGSKFIGGGGAYGLLEILWRGFTHISMIILGGICFIGLLHIYKYNEVKFPRLFKRRGYSEKAGGGEDISSAQARGFRLNMAIKSVLGGGMITAAELLAGILLNIWLSLNVWDYSGQRFQFLGQISLIYFFLWCGLSFVVFVVCRIARSMLKTKEARSGG